MDIIETKTPSEIRLSADFLAPYYVKGDPFTSLLARSTYLTKYCRDKETWTDTIRRVVEGNVSLAAGVSVKEAELLFHAFWTMQALPPGRGLWTGGVDGIPSDARFNCWFTTLYDIDDWCWTANSLMLGGGVGVGLGHMQLPVVSVQEAKLSVHCNLDHVNSDDVKPNPSSYLNGTTPIYRVPDSREGWVEALRKVLTSAFRGDSLIIDVSDIRPRGEPIRTFGGIACGPGPLTDLLRSAWGIVRGARGRTLNSVEALDITNFIGLCIKAGNVRRSALIVLGDPMDMDFRNAKKDIGAIHSHRHTSNNSIVFETQREISEFDWMSLVEDNSVYGEPGILNLALGRMTDPEAMGVNPCGEQLLHDRESCNLAEVFPARMDGSLDTAMIFRLVTRYAMRQRLTPLSDAKSQAVGLKNMRIGVGLGGICDFDYEASTLADWFWSCRREANEYADELGVNCPLTVTTVKPSGTISLLCESSPGIHAPHAPYYIRRTRIAKNDPMAEAMMEAGVPFEEDVYDKSGNTWVFSFPTKARNPHKTKETETLRGQFERQETIQTKWADNAVSATLNFDADTEKEEMAASLREFVPRFKSTSCLSKQHGYSQAPYETIDHETYETMYARIHHDHPLVRGGDIEIEECEGGVCPIR